MSIKTDNKENIGAGHIRDYENRKRAFKRQVKILLDDFGLKEQDKQKVKLFLNYL